MLALVPIGWGQSVEIGVTAGAPLTESFVTEKQFAPFCHAEEATSATRRYTVGPTLRISLTHGLGITTGALYKRIGYDSLYGTACEYVYTRAIENSWEFPVLVTYRLPGRLPAAPYVAAGPAFRFTTNVSLTAYAIDPAGYAIIADPAKYPFALVDYRSEVGFALGLGGELRAAHLRIRPELRYTRWAADSVQSNSLRSNPNQVELLVSFGVLVHERVP